MPARSIPLYWRTTVVVCSLQALASVFAVTELALLLLFALALDCSASHSSRKTITTDGDESPAALARELVQSAPVSNDNEPTRALPDAATPASASLRSDVIHSAQALATHEFLASCNASVRDSSCCCVAKDDESVNSCSTADTFEIRSLATTPSAHQPHKCEHVRESERMRAPFMSMAMSRCSSELIPSVEFLHKSGELHMRRESVLTALKPWRKCSLLLSVATGELFVHRKASAPPQVFPLALFTGASIHLKRRRAFKVVFDGHPPLHFRVAKAQDAERWVKALEYAKETTWRLWS